MDSKRPIASASVMVATEHGDIFAVPLPFTGIPAKPAVVDPRCSAGCRHNPCWVSRQFSADAGHSNVSPLVTAADTDNSTIAPVLAQPLVYAAASEQFNARNAEMFNDDGLIGRLKQSLHDDYRANAEARRIAYRVIRRDPAAFLRLAIGTYDKFYSRPYMMEILHHESGMRELSPDDLKILSQYHLDATDLPFMKTITRQYYLASWPLFVLLVITPLVLVASLFTSRGGERKYWWALLLITTVHIAAVQILGVEPSPRHLHAATVPLALAFGAMVGNIAGITRGGPRIGKAMIPEHHLV